jgi:electron transfer flavoprotein alpha subunit
MPTILTLAESRQDALRRSSLETLSEARRLADAMGGKVATVVVGSAVERFVSELAAYGADAVHVYEGADLDGYATETYASALTEAARATSPAAILIPFTSIGKDLAPRVSARLKAGLASDCVSLAVVEGRLEARRPCYAGKAFARVRFEGDPQMATLRPNVFPLGTKDDSRKAEVVKGTPPPKPRARATGFHETGGGKVELTEAQTIVSGGRGLKGPENFHLVQELADAFGAAMGASRAVVDAGWVDHQLQVGQTGKTVSPSLYIACGISGAIQHLAGMSSSKVIVAVNKDPDAPIFKIANYGLLGDVFEILPKLTAEAKAYFGKKS